MRPRLSALLLLLAACLSRHVRPVDPPGTPPTCDLSDDLSAVLETARLEGTCDDYAAGQRDDATRLRCGKWMFFHETFGTVGIPSNLLRFNQKHFAGYYGRGFARMGLIADPASDDGMPIGLAPSNGATHAFTCASCHFAQLADGRYAVGLAAERFDYGTMIASLGAPLMLTFDADSAKTAPALRVALTPHVKAAKERTGYTAEAGLLGLSLLRFSGAPLTIADQERFLGLVPGTMDFLTAPLLDDGKWTISRISSLWNLAPNTASERLSWNGGVHTLMQFLHGFAAIGVGETWTDDRLIPLRDYIYTLKPPPAPTVPNEDGARLFTERGCAKCHDGPHGEGTGLFTFEEMGTDPVYADIYAPDDAGYACCGLKAGPDSITRKVKAPRLTGLWAISRFLHNGSVHGLEELFCLSPRATDGGLGQSSAGHAMTCDGLTDDEKRTLIAWLRAR